MALGTNEATKRIDRTSEMVDIRDGGHQRWWTSGMVDIRDGGHQRWWTSEIVDIRDGGHQRWWTSEIVDIRDGRHKKLHQLTSYLSSIVMVLKFLSLRKSHSFTTESSADVAR